MLKTQPILSPTAILFILLALAAPLALSAQCCCQDKEKEGEKECTAICEKSGYLGITGDALKDTLGAEVLTVAEGSPAGKAGIKPGDVIVEIDMQKTPDFESLRKIVVSRPDAKVKVVLLRDGKKITKEVTLGAKETKEIKLKMNMPDIDFNFENIKDLMGRGTEELKKQVEELKIEVEKLKAEIEALKKK